MIERWRACLFMFIGLGMLRSGAAFAAQQSTLAGETPGTTEILLSGQDWKLGSFPPMQIRGRVIVEGSNLATSETPVTVNP